MENPIKVEDAETRHYVTVRIQTADVPNLNRIMVAAAKLGAVKGVEYYTNNY